MSLNTSIIGHESGPILQGQRLGAVGTTHEGHDISVSSIPNPFSAAGNMQFDDAFTRNFNTGVNASNFNSINHSFLLNFTKRFGREQIHRQMLCFIERASRTPILKLHASTEVASIHELNAWLISEEGRKIYGVESSSEKLMNDFAFAGSFNAEVAAWVNASTTDSTFVVARRARCQAITRAFHRPDADKTVDHSLYSIYLLAIRRKMEQDENNIKTSYPYYWSFQLHVSDGDAEPSPWLVNDDDSKGCAKRVGIILQASSNNSFRPDHMRKARRSLKGAENITERKYENDFVGLPACDYGINL